MPKREDPVAALEGRIAELSDRLTDALAERDAALLELAKERTLVNALRLAHLSRGEETPRAYPADAGLGEPPLRYLLVDRANDGLKTMLGPFQERAKRLATRFRKGGR